MTIKHLVISGGGPVMVQALGAIQHLEERGFFSRENILSIYGTSAGAIVGTLLCLHYDWETIYDYIIKRPWKDVFPIKVQNIFEAYTKKGIFDTKTFEKCFKPLLEAKDLSIQITLQEFYNFCKIELHMFAFDINEYKLHDVSYLTHPHLSLITAIHMTCSLPVLMTPVCIEDKCYIDGGLSCNYPLQYCIASGKNPDEILGFKNNYMRENQIVNETETDNEPKQVTENELELKPEPKPEPEKINEPKVIDDGKIGTNSTLLDFLMGFLFKALFSINTDHTQPSIQNEVICDVKHLTFAFMKSALHDIEVRKELYQSGIDTGSSFLLSKNCVKELS